MKGGRTEERQETIEIPSLSEGTGRTLTSGWLLAQWNDKLIEVPQWDFVNMYYVYLDS